jgi:hypothetical protein
LFSQFSRACNASPSLSLHCPEQCPSMPLIVACM